MEQKSGADIVPMQASHIEALAELERMCFDPPWSFDALADELSNPLAVFRVAEMEGGVAGYVGMHHIVDEGYITNIAVFPKFRRRGVAADLMGELFTYARENEMQLITLEVRQSNRVAIDFYARYGFKEEGRRRRFYHNPTEDALIMTRYF